MRYRDVGTSGLRLSEIGLGCGSPTFAGRVDDATAAAIIARAYELGITYFDTGETYAEGRSEELLGAALKSRRGEVVIATKFAKDRSVGPSEKPGARRSVMRAVEGSLRRLQTDYIDLYVMHEPDPATPIDETLRTLDDLVRAGTIRYAACAGFATWQFCDAMWTARHHGYATFISSGVRYNLLDRRAESEMAPFCADRGFGVVPTAPLASGLLTGKYQSGTATATPSRFNTIPPFAGEEHRDIERFGRLLTPGKLATVDALHAFAVERGHTVAELAINWLLAQPWLSSVPIGVTSVEQLERNVAGLGWDLSAEDLAALDDITPPRSQTH